MAEFIVGNAFRKIARKHQWLQNFLWRLDFALVWCLIKFFGLLPVDASSRFGHRVGSIIGPMMKRKTAVYEDNFHIAFPQKSEAEITALARASWGTAGRILGEYSHMDKILKERGGERIDIEVQGPNTCLLDPNRPAVVVAAHLSNWEVIGAAFARLGIPNTTLYSPPTNPWIDRMLLKSRESLQCQLVPRDNSAKRLMQSLKKGRTIGVVIDRRVDEGEKIPLFDQDKLTTTMPAKLALKFDCDLVPVRVERRKDANFKVTFYPPISPLNSDACESDQAVDMIGQVHRLFEQWIRQQPQDWFCSKRLWPKRKPQSPAKKQGEIDVDSYAA
ncbi:MAG: KDO2-lipid IV(A) lauroyltransferase [Halioglobus sp.]